MQKSILEYTTKAPKPMNETFKLACSSCGKIHEVEQIISKLRERLGNDPQGGKIFVLDVPVAADIKTGHTGEPVI